MPEFAGVLSLLFPLVTHQISAGSSEGSVFSAKVAFRPLRSDLGSCYLPTHQSVIHSKAWEAYNVLPSCVICKMSDV